MKEEIFRLLPPLFFEDPISSVRDMNGEVLKESRLRWAAIFTLSNGKRFFFKRDRTKGWLEYLKYTIFPSKGRKEWFVAYQSEKRHLNIPRPLGWMERIHRGLVSESYYLSAAVGSGTPLIEKPDRLNEDRTFAELVKIVKRMHDSGLDHRDLHAGNFLWDGESFYLTDLHRARFLTSLSVDQRLNNLSHLFHSLRSAWGEREQSRFLEGYFSGDPIPPQKRERFLQTIHSEMDRLQKRQWRSRTKRCLKNSTEFSTLKEKEIRYYHRRDFPLDRFTKIVEAHLQLVQEKPSELVKQDTKVLVSILNDGGNRICVKQFRYPRWMDSFKEHFRRSKGLRSWVAGNALIVRGIPYLKPMGLMERGGWLGLKESFFLMEASEVDQELDRYLFNGFKDFTEKRLFIKTFAQWLSHFHTMGIYHQDMKTCNILVSENEEGWNFRLLDLEDVLLDGKVDEKKLFKNFLQLNTSTPKNITRTGRLRFFREYLKGMAIIKNQKVFLRRLIKESTKRGFVYLSPQGVVIENR
ncbi:MAG: hypothetical protein A2V86_08600 [Deltaproteobacteria bacterium RBG_16_49_23]|nr:MAG: hypothetical protein A2V86_08600 [Deltaproteobacteria bacterium RBG_16_49_23]